MKILLDECVPQPSISAGAQVFLPSSAMRTNP
jgi:hypothetical protein